MSDTTFFDEAVEAAKDGALDRVAELVRKHPVLLSQRDDDEQQSLFDHATWALLVGDYSRPPTIAPDEDGARMAIVRLLLDEGADPNGKSMDDWTPLHTALYENHVELTELLLERGADPRAEVYGAGGTPLVQALFWGHAEAADVLAEHDVHPTNLRVAAALGRADLIDECFAEDGALRPLAFEGRGYYRPHMGFPEWTPSDDPQEVLDEAFTYAARNGRASVLPGLLARGADVDGAPYNGASLHWTASQGRLEICRWLLDRGANVNARGVFGSNRGVTPLHCAAWTDRLEVARLLVERGADRTLEDKSHEGTPLGWADYMQARRVAEYLQNLS